MQTMSFQSAPDVVVRLVMLNKAAEATLIEGGKTGPLAPLLIYNEIPRRVLQIGSRQVIVQVPERGEDGAYVVSISGDPRPLLQAGIDKYAHQYRFHRITEPTEPIALTIEWQAGDPLQDALHLVYFCQLLTQLVFIEDNQAILKSKT